MERKCLDCGDAIKGRSDKKFCSDQCRNNYNNRLNRDANSFVRNVHLVLRRNRKVLADMYVDGRTRVHKDALLAMGFNFSFITHATETSKGEKFCYCYEYGFRISDDEYAELIFNSDLLEY